MTEPASPGPATTSHPPGASGRDRAVSILVLPSYQGTVHPGLLTGLAALDISAELVRVYTDALDARCRVEPLSLAAPYRTCHLPPGTTPFRAMLFGLCYCTADAILLASGGIGLTVEGIVGLLRCMGETSAKVVVATRYGGGTRRLYPLRQRFLSALVRSYLRLLTGNPLRDPRSGLKLFRRETLVALVRDAQRITEPFDLHDLLLLSSGDRGTVVEVPAEAQFEKARYSISLALGRHVLLTPLRRSASLRWLSRRPLP